MNPADLCRECELRQRVKELEEANKMGFATLTYLFELALKLSEKNKAIEEAGDRIVKLVNEVYAMMGGPCLLQDAVKEWEKTREESK